MSAATAHGPYSDCSRGICSECESRLDARYDPLIIQEDINIPYRNPNAVHHRIFYIDIGGLPDREVVAYMETVKAIFENAKDESSFIKRLKREGRIEDYFIPMRPGISSKGFFARMKDFFFGYNLKEHIRQTSHIEFHTIDI